MRAYNHAPSRRVWVPGAAIEDRCLNAIWTGFGLRARSAPPGSGTVPRVQVA